MVDQEEIHRKCNSDDPDERLDAISQLYDIFEYIPDKQLAWQDLHRLTSDEESCLRQEVAVALRIVFKNVPDKQQAWQDLHRLTLDEDKYVRLRAGEAFQIIFKDLPDKKQAWKDLVRLTSDEYPYLRLEATKVLGIVFKDMPDEQHVWEDLHRLASDEDKDVRREIAGVFGTVFKHIPDKERVWEDLHILTSDKDIDVRVGAYHSFGRISIYKASQSEREDEYLEELEKAIEFFEISVKDSNWWHNPSSFCLPFYRSFYAIVSAKKREAKKEVEKYLSEAKNKIYRSENKKLLFEAVENLANALKEVQNLENLDFEAKKGELDFYRKYCEQASELMRNTEETVPYATAVIRKGLPLLDRKLKSLLEEIQEKAKTACWESQGTPTQEIACAVSREVQKWEISNPTDMAEYIEDISISLKGKVQSHPENEYLLNKIEVMRIEKDFTKKFQLLSYIVGEIPTIKVVKEEIVKRGIDEVRQDIASVDKKIDEKATIILNQLNQIQEELEQRFEKLDVLSVKVGGKEGESIKIFSEKLLEITKKENSKAIERFLEELLKDESILIKEIDGSSAPQNKKEESKSSISKFRSLLEKVKNPTKAFGKDVAKEIVVGYTAKGIIDLVLPMMFLAVFGVPIPSHITEILSIVLKELKE